MPIKRYKPTSDGIRFRTTNVWRNLGQAEPEQRLLESKNSLAGRNCHGRITSRHRGGGHRRQYRIIDWRRDKDGIPGKVVAIQYDPNRSARIALLAYTDGEKRYIIAPQRLEVGDVLQSGPKAEVKPGNCLPLGLIPVGSLIHNIEMRIGKGGQIARSAGVGAQLLGKEKGYVQVRMPSGLVYKLHEACRATVGEVSNPDHMNVSIGKAGRARWLGVRPQTRGVAMNPVDHPHGGGEGKSSGGRHPCSPWGVPTKGYKTRRNKRTTNLISGKRK